MANVRTPQQQQLLAAAAGNPAMLELLESLFNTVGLTQQVTNTTAKNVPAQASGQVSYLAGNYIVEITNPGASSPLSSLQAAQQAQNASLSTDVQAVTPIFHQIRAATSPTFTIAANVKTFGGDTGSTQTYWTISNLGSGNFYFQFRSSYDGVNWNQWKNANGGQSITSSPSEVTLEKATNSNWALFSLPGKQLMAIVSGFMHDTGILGLPSGFSLYSSALFAIAGPNGYDPNGNGIYGPAQCDVDLVVPSDTSGLSGIPNYPVEIRMQYQSFGGYQSPGSANVFGFAFDPAGNNVTVYTGPSGERWAQFTLPGGARIAIGQGKNNNGDVVWTPPELTWINPARVMSICSLTGTPTGGANIEGYNANTLSGLTVQADLQDSGGGVSGNAVQSNWMAIAWELGAPVQTVGGFPFLTISLQGGKEMVIGAGRSASGVAIPLPAGYTSANQMSMAVPASTTHTGNHLRGVQGCAIYGLTPVLSYSDNNNVWSGDVNWMVAAWK